jgi:hypothetical protein
MGRDHLKDLKLEGKVILKWLLMQQNLRMWIELVQERVQWRDFVNTVMNFRV